VDLVCCQTTKGVWNIAVHKTWAPIGAENFLNMVTSGFFSSKVGLFRSLKGFLIQFGLAGDPAVQKKFEETMLKGKHGNLPDDPQWLPAGPPGREINGVRRFQKGYFAYAGAGKNSRGTQLIVAFEDNLYLGGGSPWEVPWGQLVGDASFETLKKIYTGYGEAPSQGKIRNRGNQYLEAEYPLLDFIKECQVVRENVPWSSTITYIAPPPPPPTTQAKT
jgi:cyclophilin family peptidyl-prolyl cis-trans isomerase